MAWLVQGNDHRLCSVTKRRCCPAGQAEAKEIQSTKHWLGSMKDGLNSTYPVALQATFCLKDQESAPKVSSTLQPSYINPTESLMLMQSVNMLCTDLANIYMCVYRWQV